MSKYLLSFCLSVTFACMALAVGSIEAYASTDMALDPSAESEKNQAQQASGDDIQLAAVSGDALGAQGGNIVPDGGGTSGVTPAELGASEQLSEPLSGSLNQGDESTVVASAPPVPGSMLEKNIDNDGDGRTELVTFYNYDNANTTLWQFDSADTGFAAPRLAWSSGTGNWEWSRSRITRTDYDGDGKTELAIIYNYGGANTGLWLFDPTDTGFAAPRSTWSSGAGNWEWLRSKIANGEHFKPRTSLISITLLEVNLSTQTLIVHGNMVIELEERFFNQTAGPFTSFLICSGKPGWETPTGLYRIHSKQIAVDMSSGPDWSEQYYVPGVPYVFWIIDTMYAVHGAYWLGDSEFGTPRSHGCINVPVSMGAWLYDWVPVGTELLIHY